MSPTDKPLVWLHGQIKTPPLPFDGGHGSGVRHLQVAPLLQRIRDEAATWRIVYRIDPDAIVIVEVFSKKTQAPPQSVIQTCRRRLSAYDNL